MFIPTQEELKEIGIDSDSRMCKYTQFKDCAEYMKSEIQIGFNLESKRWFIGIQELNDMECAEFSPKSKEDVINLIKLLSN